MIGGIIMRKSERPFMVEFSGTPEAGKTTSILTVSKMHENAGYTTEILRESAESLPDEISKGTFHANMWMHFITQAGILKATYSKADVVLIDRGIIDSQFYAWKYFNEGSCTKSEFDKFLTLKLDDIEPNLFLGIVVLPDTALERRGGAGRLVNEEYVKRYNDFFLTYFTELDITKELISTDELDKSQMSEIIFNTISKFLL